MMSALQDTADDVKTKEEEARVKALEARINFEHALDAIIHSISSASTHARAGFQPAMVDLAEANNLTHKEACRALGERIERRLDDGTISRETVQAIDDGILKLIEL